MSDDDEFFDELAAALEGIPDRPCIPGEDECEGCYYCDGEATDEEIAAHIARVREATP